MAQRDWFERDYYSTLGVSEKATKDEIKKAYRKLAQKHHPDANKDDPSAETRFKEISEAHAILSNDEKRKEYDQVRAFARTGGGPGVGFRPGHGGGNVRVNIGDLFGDQDGGLLEDLLGGGFGFNPRAPQRGEDLETRVELSFDDAVGGTTVSLPQGTKVKIPPGVGDGARIRVAGKGGPGRNGGPAGDLFVRVSVDTHPIFGRGKDGDLTLTLPVTFTEAALGAKVEVPTLDGTVTVKIPPGTPNGKTLRVRGRGGPRGRSGNGDLLVKVAVEVPEKLSKREKELLEEFAEEHDASPREHLDGYVRSSTRARAS